MRMNWREVFKRTGYILIFASIATLLLLADFPNAHEQYYWQRIAVPLGMIIVIAINLCDISVPSRREFTRPWGRHALWILVLSCIGALPLSLFLLRVPLGDYITFCFWVSLIGFIGALIMWILNVRMTSRGEGLEYQPPEKIVEWLGQPIQVINQESKMIYAYKDMDVIFTNNRVSEVQLRSLDLTGLLPEQVVKILGQPKKRINVESKMIYVYKDIKIIFAAGRVADVQ